MLSFLVFCCVPFQWAKGICLARLGAPRQVCCKKCSPTTFPGMLVYANVHFNNLFRVLVFSCVQLMILASLGFSRQLFLKTVAPISYQDVDIKL